MTGATSARKEIPRIIPAATTPHDRADFDISDIALYLNVMVTPN
jgi:hypothetical protein